MEKQRFIFDLDGTLLTNDFSMEQDFFTSIYGDRASLLLDHMGELLGTFESTHPRYDVDVLANYLTKKTGLRVTPEIIEDWIHLIALAPDTMEEGVWEALEYLKEKDKSLAVLTNWFAETQLTRLERAELLDFFDQVYTGDQFLKPRKIAYKTATGLYIPDECLFIGDNLDFDYIGPKACGMDSLLYDKKGIQHKSVQKIKRMDEIIRRY